MEEYLRLLALLLPFAFISLWLARRLNFFSYPKKWTFQMSGFRVLGVFLIYFCVGYLLRIFSYFYNPSPRVVRGAIYLLPVIMVFLILPLWKRNTRPFLRPLLFGASSLFIVWPIMTFFAAALTFSLLSVGIPVTDYKQLALESFIQVLGDPILFPIALASTIFFVPLVEELIFRGFFQGWLSRHLPRQLAIWLTAVLFCLLHYAPTQGYANMVILPAVLGLGWFLGHLYEREGSLAAPIALHILFNCVGIFHEILAAIPK